MAAKLRQTVAFPKRIESEVLKDDIGLY